MNYISLHSKSQQQHHQKPLGPYLCHAVRDGLPHPPHHRVQRIRAQGAPRVLGLAVGATTQAAGGQGHDFHQGVAAHLGQVQGGEGGAFEGALPEQLHALPPHGALHHFDHALQLGHAHLIHGGEVGIEEKNKIRQ